MEMIPVEDIGKSSTSTSSTPSCAFLRVEHSIANVQTTVGRMYHLGCPPSNKELVADATVFVEEAAKLEATGEIKEAAITILEDLAFTINDRGTGAYPVGQQYEFLKKQVTFLGAIIQLIERPPKPGMLSFQSPQTAPRGGHGARTPLNIADHCYSLTDTLSRL